MTTNLSLQLPIHTPAARRKIVSLCVISTVALLGTTLAQAQTTATRTGDEAVVLDEFVVSGVRASMIRAQEIKQNASQVMDSIVAEDIGKLPDNTVADALQRVPGVQVSRNIGEVSSVVIRGLPNLATTLNGNEIFTGTTRGVALQDIPAELIGAVDVYKSTSPEKLEGGIAGLIDIRLRRPFDFNKPQFAVSAQGIYGENAEDTSYIGSVLLSDRWAAGKGEVGVLYSGSYQQRYYVDQIAFNFLFEPVNVPPTLVPGQTQLQLPFTQGGQVIPADRKRFANNLSLQWRINDELEIYDDFLNTGFRGEHQVHFLIGFPRFGEYTSATVHQSTNVPITTTSRNNFHLTSTQAFKQSTDGYHNVLGAKWKRGGTMVTGEYMYNWNSFKNQALIVDTRYGPPTPDTFTFTYYDDGRPNLKIGPGITDPANYYLWGLFDNRDYSTSEQNGLKLELEQALSNSFLRKIAGGVLWSSRDVQFRATTRNDIPPAGATNGDRFAPTVPKVSTIQGFSSLNQDGPLDYYSIPHWIGASPDFLYGNPDQVRALFGLPPGPAGFNPTSGFTDEESVLAGFVNAHFATEMGEMPFDGTLGVRVAETEQKLQGFRTNGEPLNAEKSQTDVLPVLNSRLKITDRLQLRFTAGRTITRPDFDDLNPAVTLNAPTTTGGAAGTGSGGNPDLETVESDNYDLSLEYYFAPASYVAVTGFHRDIQGYVQSFAATEVINGVTYNVIRPRNSGEGQLDGVEFSYQHFPEVLRGFGWMTNYTYIDGDTDAPDSSPGAPVGARVRKPYAQVSRDSFNVILVYEAKKFSSRLAYNWRGEYTDTFDGPNAPGSPLRQIIVESRDQLDFDVSYAFTDRLRVTLQATNILKSEYRDYFADPSLYRRDVRAYDRTISLGFRYRY